MLSLVAVAACLSGCVSLHTASIFMHDSIRFPSVGMNSKDFVSEGGIVVKTTPTKSACDLATTESIQGGYVHTLVFPFQRNLRFSLAGAVSGYYAANTLYGVFNGTENEEMTYTGYGFTGQLKPTFFYKMDESRFIIGGNFVYAKEFGDYLAFRSTLNEPNSYSTSFYNRCDLSPNGQTLSASLVVGYANCLDKENTVSGEVNVGLAFPAFLYEGFPFLTASLTATYTGRHFWTWVGCEFSPSMNTGISVGLGLRLR